MTNAIYIDENGNRIDPSTVGKDYEVVGKSPTSTSPNIQSQMMQEQRVTSFISQTSPSLTLESINYILQGYVYNTERSEWVKVSDGIPDNIRLDFLQFITPDLSEDVRMTCLDAKQINGIMEFVIEWVVDYLDIVADKEKISEEQMTKISLIMIKAVYYTILRAQSGMERSKIFSSLKMGEQLNPPQMQQQRDEKWWKFWK